MAKNPNEKTEKVNADVDPATLFENQGNEKEVSNDTTAKNDGKKSSSSKKQHKDKIKKATPKYGKISQGDTNITLDREGLDFVALSALLAATGFEDVEDYLASDDEMTPKITCVESGDDSEAAKFMTLAKVIYSIGSISAKINGLVGKLDALSKSVDEINEKLGSTVDGEDLDTLRVPYDGDHVVIKGDMYGDIVYGDKLHNYGNTDEDDDESEEGADDDDDYVFDNDCHGCKCHGDDEDDDDGRTLEELTDSIVIDIISKVSAILYEACQKLGKVKFTKKNFLKKYGFMVESFIPEEVLNMTESSKDAILDELLDVVHSHYLYDGKESIFTDGVDVRADEDDGDDEEGPIDLTNVLHLLKEMDKDDDGDDK